MEWTELSIYTSSEGVELLCGKLLELGINGFAVEDARDFEEFLEQVRPNQNDFMFLDPPYDTEFSDYEGNAFTKLDQARLAVALSKTPAKFLLIIKNTPFIEALYSEGFYVQRFDKQYSYNVRSRNDRKAEHLVITNYKID